MVKACAAESTPFRYLYPLSDPVRSKIEAVCSKIYLAGEVTFSELASSQIDAYEAQGLGRLPICIAKTQYSLSTDPSKKGAPSGHTVNVREVRAAIGAGFLYLLCGDIMTVLRCVEITLQAPRHRRDVSLLDFHTGAGAADASRLCRHRPGHGQ